MKKFTLLVCAVIISITTFAQFPCPTSYQRSNGGSGACTEAKLTLRYSECPPFAYGIDSIYSNGVKLNVTAAPGAIDCGSKKEVHYCLDNNIPPGVTLTIYFTGGVCTVESSSGPLPVTLSSFTAIRKGNNVQLDWKTEMEVNAKDFIVEKRSGNSFVTIATIGAADVTTGSRYTFTDINTSKGITEYRLLMTDLDGSAKYSEVRPVKGVSGIGDVTVYPNPSTGSATVLLNDGFENAQVQVMDNAGKMVKKVNVTGSSTTLNLAGGLYHVRVINTVTGEAVTTKLTVIK